MTIILLYVILLCCTPAAMVFAAGRYYSLRLLCEFVKIVRFQGRRRLHYISGKSTVLYAVLYCMRYEHARPTRTILLYAHGNNCTMYNIFTRRAVLNNIVRNTHRGSRAA